MTPFKINIPKEAISDLNDRIKSTRWIRPSADTTLTNSLSFTTLKAIAAYWQEEYDWKEQEAYLNSFPQYRTGIEGLNIHFVHHKGTNRNNKALLLLHGWASTFAKYLKLVALFKKNNPDLDIIVPSMPGFGFSDEPAWPITTKKVSSILHRLMTEGLGYDGYYIHGGDFGAFVGEQMAMDFPEHVKGLHLSDIPYYHLYGYHENLSEKETQFIEKVNTWSMTDGAYAAIQSTKPRILSTALNDSPAGLAAWLLQLHHDFSDNGKDLLEKFDKADLLNNVCIYWFTQSIYSSMRIYSEDNHGFGEPPAGITTVPTACCFFPHDISGIPPREFIERFFSNVVNISEQKSGGHFAALEHPDVLHQDIVSFIKMIEP